VAAPQNEETIIPDDLDEHPFFPLPVELAVEDLLRGAEVQPAVRDGDHHLPAHDLALQVCVTVVLAGAVVLVARNRLVGRKRLKPDLVS